MPDRPRRTLVSPSFPIRRILPAAIVATLVLGACSDPQPSSPQPPPPQAAQGDEQPGTSPPQAAELLDSTELSATPSADGNPGDNQAGLTREVTLYSGDFPTVAQGNTRSGWAWAVEQWTPNLAQGTLVKGGLPMTTDPSTVVLEPAADAQVQGQRFVGSQDPQALRAMAVGQPVKVWTPMSDTPLAGTLVNAEGAWILSNGDQTTVVDQVVAWQGPVAAGSSSRWEWDVPQAGTPGPWTLNYGFTGAAWQADTVLAVQPGPECALTWATDALIANRSGQDIRAQGLTLVAGTPNHDRDHYPQASYARVGAEMAMAAPMAPPAPTAEGEQYRYTLTGVAELPHGAIARVPLVRPTQAVACQRQYVVGQANLSGPPARPWLGAQGAGEQNLPVQWQLAIDNTAEAGLGMPLPAGRVRVTESGTWAGDARIEHTSVGTSLNLALGQPFDLTAKRTVAAFNVDSDRLGASETVRVVLKNAKAADATIQIHEAFPRWQGWELAASTVQPSQTHAQGAQFDVLVPANSEAVLEYTVHYRWPDLGPQG